MPSACSIERCLRTLQNPGYRDVAGIFLQTAVAFAEFAGRTAVKA